MWIEWCKSWTCFDLYIFGMLVFFRIVMLRKIIVCIMLQWNCLSIQGHALELRRSRKEMGLPKNFDHNKGFDPGSFTTWREWRRGGLVENFLLIITWSVVFVSFASKMAVWSAELFGIRLRISPMPDHFRAWKDQIFTTISTCNWSCGKWVRKKEKRRERRV